MRERFTESVVEEAALSWFADEGYQILHGGDLVPGERGPDEAGTYQKVVLEERLMNAVRRLNPGVPAQGLEEAVRKVVNISSPSLVDANHEFHHYLVNGVSVEYLRPDGTVGYAPVRLVDFEDADANDWAAVNQFTVTSAGHHRRPDIVVFINGLPLAVLELKNAANEDTTVFDGFNQLQTYKSELPALFVYNEALIVSDGLSARIGSLTADFERFMPWRTIEGEDLAPRGLAELEVLLRGAFHKLRLLTYLRYYIVFERQDAAVIKKMAGYHQFHAAEHAVLETVGASRPGGDRRVGVVWHTQGSGKSLTMAFYAGRVMLHPEMENPTLVILTDRNDLDEQLFNTFAACSDLIRQAPVQAASRSELRDLLQKTSGGVVFTTIQKFLPETRGDAYPKLSDRRNIVVIADEAHRSQYDFIDGFARHMRDALPHASFIGFTGTPVELTDKNTRAVFGDYISIYDIQRAVEDGATVPIYYESRLARLSLNEDEKPKLDEEIDEVTEGEELSGKERYKTKWSALAALVGTEKRLNLVAEDLVEHFENRLDVLSGKAMIVCMSRSICVDLYNRIIALRPMWHHPDEEKGEIKIVMSGSASDPVNWQPHIRSKMKREAMAKRFRKPDDSLKIVIVRDMWLTGFDAPCLHTMYIDKPMRGHGLMQAIARVNRVFKDKPGGLVVDYLGIADSLRRALHNYTESGGRGDAKLDQEAAAAVMLEKFEICSAMFHGFDKSKWFSTRAVDKLSLLPEAQEHILCIPNGKDRFLQAVTDLSKAFALAVPHDEALAIRDEVGFYQAVRAAIAKTTGAEKRTAYEIDHAIRQIVSKAVSSDEVIDVFQAAGIKKPDISILSDAFLSEIQGMPHRNLAIELLRKLLGAELKTRSKTNLVQSRSFAKMLEQSIRKYQNRALETAEIIEELIALAKEMRKADERGVALGLTLDETAFYDALEVNDSAVKVLGEETLKDIAKELVDAIRRNVTIDWTVKETVRAKMRVMVKRILKRYGYPPDKQAAATETVMAQAELLSEGWSIAS